MPILSELTSSQNNENIITPIAVPQLSQTPLDELILPPVLVPQLQMGTNKPSTMTNIPHQLDTSPKLGSNTEEPLSLELFNQAMADLNNKGFINLKNIANT